MILSLHFIFWQGLAGPFVQVFRDGEWFVSRASETVNSLIWIQFLWLVCPHNKDDNIPKHCFKTKQSLHLVVSFTLDDGVHQIPSCCFRASGHSHLEHNIQYCNQGNLKTVLEITSVGTQIMVYFFPGCAQSCFSKDPSQKMVINAAYLKAKYKEVVRLVIFDTEGHKIACRYTLKETHTDAPNIYVPLIINERYSMHAPWSLWYTVICFGSS